MAAAVEAVAGDRIAAGLAVTKDGHGRALARIALREAAHPVPDARSERGGARGCSRWRRARRPTTCCWCCSRAAPPRCWPARRRGSRSARAARDDARAARGGRRHRELNTVRKHLVDGRGRAARRAPRGAARVEVLVVSDVLGDRLDVIGSGPCTPDPTTFADALAVLDRCVSRSACRRACARTSKRARAGAARGDAEARRRRSRARAGARSSHR